MDLNKVATDALAKVIASGRIEESIEKNIAATIEAVLKSELREYSDFGKEVTEAVKSALKIGEMGLPAYNDLIVKIVRKSVGQKIAASIESQVGAQLEELLQSPPESITLSKLVEEFRGYCTLHSDHDDANDGEGYGTCTIIFETNHSISRLYLDKDRNKEKYQCEFCLMIHEGTVCNVRISGEDVKKTLFVGSLYGFERLLFQLSVCGTKVIQDVDMFYPDTSYKVGSY